MNINSLNDLISGVQASLGLEQEVEKQASVNATTAEDSLEEMLSKEASHNESEPIGEIPQMNKQAHEQGVALADQILAMLMTKEANEVVMQTAAHVAQDDAKVQPNPTQEQTVTEVLQNNILKAIAEGAAQEDAVVAAGAPAEAAVEGAAQAALPAIEGVSSDEVEKVAAVAHLIGEGRTFEDAVALVKQASEEIAAEQVEMAKLAATQHLMTEAGVSLEDAVALVNYGVSRLAG